MSSAIDFRRICRRRPEEGAVDSQPYSALVSSSQGMIAPMYVKIATFKSVSMTSWKNARPSSARWSRRQRTRDGRAHLEGVVFGFQSVRVVPGEGVSDDEAAQQVVAAEHADDAEREEGQGDAVRKEGLVVDPEPRTGVLESDPRESDG